MTVIMKQLLAFGIFALVLLMTACSDKPVTAEQIPDPIKAFIEQNFPGQPITYAEKDFELGGSKYDVVLVDGSRVEFDADNVWDKIEGTMTNPVPTALIPAAIATHIQANFPDAMILKIDKEHDGYEIELANGLELKFNKQGALIEMDD